MAGLMDTFSAHQVYLWLITAVTGAVSVNTLMRLWTERRRLTQEDLNDEDRTFAWRIVLFLVYPLMTLVDLRATMITCEWLGGYIKDWSYGLFWYSAIPRGIVTHDQLLIVLFSGVVVQIVLALSLLPALAFRPHPFLATVIGYTIGTVLCVNLFVDPVLSLLGIGGSRWQLLISGATAGELLLIAAVYAGCAGILGLVVFSERTRLWFADLTRPLVCEQLRDVLLQWKLNRQEPLICARLAVLYERAGLRSQALKRLAQLQTQCPQSIYRHFTEAMLSYSRRRSRDAREHFLLASEYANSDPQLRGSLIAAAACAAFVDADLEGSLNLAERALEFDDSSLVARMVKVDVFLRQGKKEQAGEEIIAAIRRGLDMDLESNVPLDSERAFKRIARLQATQKQDSLIFTR